MSHPNKHHARCTTCGQKVGLSLTPEDVVIIKQRIKAGDKTSNIAKCFGVSFQAIARIKTGQNWSNVDIITDRVAFLQNEVAEARVQRDSWQELAQRLLAKLEKSKAPTAKKKKAA